MNNDAKGKTRPQVRSGPLITGAVLVGAGTFFVLIEVFSAAVNPA